MVFPLKEKFSLPLSVVLIRVCEQYVTNFVETFHIFSEAYTPTIVFTQITVLPVCVVTFKINSAMYIL